MSIRAHLAAYAALMLLLTATVLVHRFELGVWNLVLNMSIAGFKAVLIALIFMRLARAASLVRIFALVGLVWLAVLFTLVLADYLDRQPPERYYRAAAPARADPAGPRAGAGRLHALTLPRAGGGLLHHRAP